MAKVLYIQASPRVGRSSSIQVADAFVEAYRAKHPADKVETLNLFTAALPSFDGLTINGKYNIVHGKEFSSEQKKAWDAVGKVHSDIKRGFIRAETMAYADIHQLGDEKAVKAAGKMRLEGKTYIVHDGDIINFRFNV
jgi:FMN-dependent NADH-azoreductase